MDKEAYQILFNTEESHWWAVSRRRILSSLINKFVDASEVSNKKVLEIGSGTGINLQFFAKKFPLIRGIETDELALELTRKRTGINVVSGSLPYDIACEDGSLDVVMLLDVLEHVEDDKSSVSAIRKKLKDGGSFVLTVPAFMFLWSGHDVMLHHFRRYEKNNLEKILLDAGFKVEYMSYCNTFLFPPIASIVLLKKLFKDQSANMKPPGKIMNAVFKFIFSLEKFFLGKISFPFGVSIVAICKK